MKVISEIRSPAVELDKLGKKEFLTLREKNGGDEVVFELPPDSVADIVSELMGRFTPDQLELLAAKIVFGSLSDEQFFHFFMAVLAEQKNFAKFRKQANMQDTTIISVMIRQAGGVCIG